MVILIGAIGAILTNWLKKITDKYGKDWALVWAFVVVFLVAFAWQWYKGSDLITSKLFETAGLAWGLAVAWYEVVLARFGWK